MSFFDSEIVQEEMKEIQTLQNKVYSNVWTFPNMNDKDKLEHIDALESLLHKQQILFITLQKCLIDDNHYCHNENGL